VVLRSSLDNTGCHLEVVAPSRLVWGAAFEQLVAMARELQRTSPSGAPPR